MHDPSQNKAVARRRLPYRFCDPRTRAAIPCKIDENPRCRILRKTMRTQHSPFKIKHRQLNSHGKGRQFRRFREPSKPSKTHASKIMIHRYIRAGASSTFSRPPLRHVVPTVRVANFELSEADQNNIDTHDGPRNTACAPPRLKWLQDPRRGVPNSSPQISMRAQYQNIQTHDTVFFTIRAPPAPETLQNATRRIPARAHVIRRCSKPRSHRNLANTGES